MMIPTIDQVSPGTLNITVAYAGVQLNGVIVNGLPPGFTITQQESFYELTQYLNNQPIINLPDIILLEIEEAGECFDFVKKLKENPLFQGLIIVLISAEKRKEWKHRALELKVNDYYTYPFPVEHLAERLHFLVKFKLIKPMLADLQDVDVVYRFPLNKRVFDVMASACALLLLSPFLLIIAILIRLDSKGPAIYKSKRVGTGYKIFDFYKFRSMHINAEEQLDSLSYHNQYMTAAKEVTSNPVFIKIKNDPRITRFGRFIRDSSIDELPQLLNVLKGDMSLVGNRPLPLYEAQMLTSNEWSMRFMGPSGVTGLWQITKRGNKVISELERKKLDNFYALKYSFWLDMRILLKTFPALFQKEKV